MKIDAVFVTEQVTRQLNDKEQVVSLAKDLALSPGFAGMVLGLAVGATGQPFLSTMATIVDAIINGLILGAAIERRNAEIAALEAMHGAAK